MDALGNPIVFHITAGNVNEGPIALTLLEQVSLTEVNVVADRAYGAKTNRDYITEQGGTYTIPPKITVKEQWETNWWIYKERHVIECFFNRLKHFRRLATRYDKTTRIFRTFLYIASILLMTR